ncbi:MAG: hypothetical protein MJY52_04260 [Bacteroidaceae bacterium]|nr:hypothetical protein [Bacteroidaceae bacterium]
MSNSLLWYQPKRLSEKDVITCNGVIIKDTIEYREIFDQIKKAADQALWNKEPWCGKVGDKFFFKGHLNERDELGRILSFMFLTDDSNYKSALDKELKTIGYELDENSTLCLQGKKVRKKHSYKKLILLLLIIFALTLILYKYAN